MTETTYDFDIPLNRIGSGCIRYDGMMEHYGRSDLQPHWIADMDFAVCPAIIDALKQRLEHPVLGYPTVDPGYIQAIIDWEKRRHGLDINPEELTFIPGVVKGMAFAINFFTSPGDKIVIQPPVYPPFRNKVTANNRIVVENPLILTDGTYHMDFDHLEKVLAEQHPAMMILCNPHNPAGRQWDADTLRRLASLCKQYGVLVLSDEIHGDLMLRGIKHIPFASVSDEAAEISVTMGAPSKTFNIPGMVSSWYMCKNPAIRNKFFSWLDGNEFNAPTLMAMVATKAAYNHGEAWLESLLAYLQGTVEAVEAFCAANIPAIRPIRPDASFLIWLDCRDLALTQPQLVSLFTDRAGLALNDGCAFGSQGSGFMRFNIASPRSVILNALQKLSNAINS
ncbi:MAG: pyridoxal phosphate-dependent aminotransferase [Muribaculaceae bacterium]|nr:pyridoxal phosphate-dependent aminotransferase [Muribaculaceae bacterium]